MKKRLLVVLSLLIFSAVVALFIWLNPTGIDFYAFGTINETAKECALLT